MLGGSGLTNGETQDPIWFRLQGDTNGSWTEWFSYCCFDTLGVTYQWDETLDNVGNIEKATILTRSVDGLYMWKFGVDSDTQTSFTFDGYVSNKGIWLKYQDGGPHYDGCEYVTVNFVNQTSRNPYFSGTQLGGEPCPFLSEYSFPTTEPSLRPTSDPTLEPSLRPTNDPTLEPSLLPTSPTNHPTLFPTTVPTHS